MVQPVNRLNINVTPALVNKEGGTGPYARMFLPFYGPGYWFNSGLELTFNRSSIPQDQSMLLQGQKRPNTFIKDCCSCLY